MPFLERSKRGWHLMIRLPEGHRRIAEFVYLIPTECPKRVFFAKGEGWSNIVGALEEEGADEFVVEALEVASVFDSFRSERRECCGDASDGGDDGSGSSEEGILVFCRWSVVAALREALARAGYEDVAVYGLSPTMDDPRFAIPTCNNRISAGALALYQPSLRIAKLRKIAAYAMSRVGLTKLWAPVAAVTGRAGGAKVGGILSVVRREMGSQASIALFTGTPGPQRKATFAVLGPRGEALGFGKIASTPATRALIRNEAKMLRRLETEGMGAEHVPRLLAEGRLGDGAEFLIESTVKKPLAARTSGMGLAQGRFLVELFARTKAVEPDRGRAIVQEISGRLYGGGRPQVGRGAELVGQGLARCAASLDFGEIPVMLVHGDFTPWNSFETRRGLFVFDWELGREAWYPMADAFHYVIQKYLFVERRGARELFVRMLRQDAQEGGWIHWLLGEMGLAKAVLLPLLILYLCDVYASYASRTAAGGEESDQDVQRLLGFWLDMLAEACR